jgi:hypothetical protein
VALEVGSVVARLGSRLDDDGFDRFERRLARARADGDRGATAHLSGDFDDRGFIQFSARARTAETDSDNLTHGLSNLTQAAGGAAGSLGGGGGMADSLGRTSLSLSATIPLVASAIPVVVALTGAAGALGGSLLAAAAGAAAVGVGVAAAAGPLATLAGAIIGRVNLIGEAYNALSAAQDQSGAAAIASGEAQHAAAVGVRNAALAVQDAKRAEVSAQGDLTAARFKARREIEDLTAAVSQSAATEERAGLTLREVVLRLREIEADPSASGLDVEQARNAVREARLEVDKTSQATSRAREDQRRGTETIRNAEDALAQATRQRERATAAAGEASRAATVASSKQSAAVTATDLAVGKLTESERGLLGTVRTFADEFRKSFQPATDAIFRGVDSGLQKVEPLLSRFSGRFAGIGDTIGDVLDHAAGSLAGPTWTRALDSFIDTTGRIVKPISNAFGSVLVILRDIAVAAQPYVIEFAHWMERALGGIADKTGDARRLDDVIATLVDHTRKWADLGGSVVGLFSALFQGGARDGKSLVETITRIVDRWTAFLNTREGQQQLRRFFHDSVERTKDFFRVVFVLADAFFKLFDTINHNRVAFAIVVGGLVAIAGAVIGVPALILAIGTALVVAYTKSRTFREVVEVVFQHTRKTIGEFVDFFLGMATTFLGGLSSMASAASHVPIIGDKFKGIANGIDTARDAIDGLREGIRKATDPMGHFATAAQEMGRKAYRSFADLRKDSLDQLKRIKSGTLDESKQAKDALATNFRVAADAVQRQTKRMGGSTEDAMAKVHKLMVDALHAYGLKATDAHKLFPNYEDRIAGGLAAGPPAPGRARGGRVQARAGGGWIGQAGQAGGDNIFMDAPVGAAILNRHQLPYASIALASQGASLADVGLGVTSGRQTAPVAVGAGEFMVDPGSVGLLDRALGAVGLGGLDTLFSSIRRPHYMAPTFAAGGLFSQAEMEALWAKHGGGDTKIAGAVGMAESGGDPNAGRNHPYHGLWQVGPGGPFDPDENAKAGIAKWRVGGNDVDRRWKPWEAYTGPDGVGSDGPWRKFIGGANSAAAAVAGASSRIARVARQVIPNVQVDRTEGLLSMVGQGATNIARRAAQRILDRARPGASAGVAAGTSATAQGPDGIGTFEGTPMANWVIGAMRYARGKGFKGRPTSGYRSHAHNVAQGRTYFSEHEGTQYPHGAVDFGGYHDASALATKLAFTALVSDYKYPLLNPIGFVDDGHASGTGHAGGGIVQAFKTGGKVKVPKTSARRKPTLSARDDKADTQRIARGNRGISGFEDTIQSLEAQYQIDNRRADLDPDDFLVENDDGSITIDENVRADRASELGNLRRSRALIRARIDAYIAAVKTAIAAYEKAIADLRRAIKAAKGKARKKERAGYKDTLEAYTKRRDELGSTLGSLGIDLQDSDIDLEELDQEIGAVSPAAAAAATRPATADLGTDLGIGVSADSASLLTPDETAAQANIGMAISLAKLTPDTADDEAARKQGQDFWRAVLDRLQGAGAPPDQISQAADTLAGFLPAQGAQATANPALDNASAIFAEVQRMTSARADLFGNFGRNFVGAGQSMFPGELGAAAGTRFFGAGGSGPSGTLRAGGVQQVNHITLADPGDVHVFTQSALHELQAAV